MDNKISFPSYFIIIERKKHICNTTMMNISKTGWVEIDIKRAIYIWESVERQQQLQTRQQPIQIGWLMIEVHDEEENPLKPGLFFNPPKCDQAGMCCVCQAYLTFLFWNMELNSNTTCVSSLPYYGTQTIAIEK